METNAEWRVVIPIPADSDINTLTLWMETVAGGYPVYTFSTMDNNGAVFYVKNIGSSCSNVIVHWSVRK